MKPGDSFVVPISDREGEYDRAVKNVFACFHQWKRKSGSDMKIVTRRTTDGLRVWREGVAKKVEIEKDIPIPPRRASGRRPKYPLREMEIGDSFKVECAYGEEMRTRMAIRGCFKRHRDRKFETRIAEGAVRVWRVK